MADDLRPPAWLFEHINLLAPEQRGVALGFMGSGFIAGVDAGRQAEQVVTAAVSKDAAALERVVRRLVDQHEGEHAGPDSLLDWARSALGLDGFTGDQLDEAPGGGTR